MPTHRLLGVAGGRRRKRPDGAGGWSCWRSWARSWSPACWPTTSCTCGEPRMRLGLPLRLARPRLHTRLPRPRAWRRLRRCRHRLPPQSRRQLQQNPWRNLNPRPRLGKRRSACLAPTPRRPQQREPLCSNGPRPRSTRATWIAPRARPAARLPWGAMKPTPCWAPSPSSAGTWTKPSVCSARPCSETPATPTSPASCKGCAPGRAGRL